ncbi:class I SAM-dependent methyltransferase [Candidatus Omnitrophota bacterium]
MTQEEELFHNQWAVSLEPEAVLVDETFAACTAPENRLIVKRLGEVKNKTVMDLGCGAGEAAVYFAKQGADVIAVDASTEMLQLVRKVAGRHGVSVVTEKLHSEKLDFEDESFDIVYAANLLHHVEIEKTVREIRRVLKKGGIFVSYDPLAYNPFINIYRNISTEVRTKNEHPLTVNDIKTIKKIFQNVATDAKWLITLWIFVKFYFVDRINPNKERFWKKSIEEHKKLENLYDRLERVDNFILAACPFLKIFCWNVVIFAVK